MPASAGARRSLPPAANMIRAAIFDLDDTLLDSKALFAARERRDLMEVIEGGEETEPAEPN